MARKLIAIITTEGKIKRVPEANAGQMVNQIAMAVAQAAFHSPVPGFSGSLSLETAPSDRDPESDALGED